MHRVFEGSARNLVHGALTPPATRDGDWKETVLHRFGGRDQDGDGSSPVAGLLMSKNGSLYGTTQWGGISANGTVFELKPPETASGEWIYTVAQVHQSHWRRSGAHRGSTHRQGRSAVRRDHERRDVGKRHSVQADARAGAWTETVLYNFTGHNGDGAAPGCIGHLILDGSGALYGTTQSGGASNVGTVFKLKL